MAETFNILILCTGNSARSILGEALVETHANQGFRGFSAGSTPKGQPHPMALEVLAERGHAIDGFTSKSWDVYGGADAPEMHAIITVCDNAAGEVCPYWPGHPIQAHWGLPDPAAIEDPAAQRRAFEETYDALQARIEALVALPVREFAPETLKAAIQAIHT